MNVSDISKEQLIDAIKWLLSDDTGTSSETILAAALDIKFKGLFSWDAPSDPSDLGRCIRLLDKLPWIKDLAFSEIFKSGSVNWKNIINNWDILQSLYFEELPSGNLPKTYDLMKYLRGEQ